MPNTVFIHIGTPKTGSTHLQLFAERHASALAAMGLLYPEAGRRAGGHHDLAFLLGGGYPDWAKPGAASLDEFVPALGEEIRSFDGDVLLSSENFDLFPAPEALADLLTRHGVMESRRVRIIVYLRRQDEYVLSWYNQKVKAMGFCGDVTNVFDELLDLGSYATRLAAWAAVFGRDALDVRSYAFARRSDGLIEDFLASMGLSGESLPPDHATAKDTNTSLARDALEVQLAVNRLPIPIAEKRAFHRSLMEISQAGQSWLADGPLLSRAERRDFLERFDEQNASVSETYFDGAPFFSLDDLDGEEPPPYPGLAMDRAISLLAWMILRGDGR